CRERGALALAERRLARREPRERWDEAIQNIEPADRAEPFAERHRAMRDRRRNGIAHIHAHTDRQPLQSLAVPTALAQDARELALPQQHVVGPFEARLEPAEKGIDRIRDGEPDADRDHAQLGAHRTEQHAEPDPARRRSSCTARTRRSGRAGAAPRETEWTRSRWQTRARSSPPAEALRRPRRSPPCDAPPGSRHPRSPESPAGS